MCWASPEAQCNCQRGHPGQGPHSFQPWAHCWSRHCRRRCCSSAAHPHYLWQSRLGWTELGGQRNALHCCWNQSLSCRRHYCSLEGRPLGSVQSRREWRGQGGRRTSLPRSLSLLRCRDCTRRCCRWEARPPGKQPRRCLRQLRHKRRPRGLSSLFQGHCN